MSLFSRFRSKAKDATEKMMDPEKQLELAISELEDTRKKALAELVTYKATAKRMEQQIAEEQGRAGEWERRAMAAVKVGDDELAKKALRERQSSLAEIARIQRDRDEAASYAIQLNKSRKVAETKLQMLKLRKGTLATQLKAARTGSALGVDMGLFDKLSEAEQRIDDEAIEAEVMAAMQGEDTAQKLTSEEFDRKLLASGADPGRAGAGAAADADDPLEALKARMAADKARKPGPGGA